MAAPGRVILLNGVGSAGKSSIARALQVVARETFLHVAMDAFLDMLPAALFDHPEGLVFETRTVDGRPEVVIHTGPAAERALVGMQHAVVAMAQAGNNLIVDDVMLGDTMAEYRRLLAGIVNHAVGVHAPLDVLEARERARGDRMIGLSRWQFPRVHAGIAYDLEIDTASATPEACARLICERLGL
ncbi:MAG: chloramphenicol phosphotransferase [Hyphomicrobiaceae bacterium]